MEDDKHLKSVRDTMDMDRTDGLFKTSIERAESLKKRAYSEKDVKTQNIVIKFGNLHVNTAKAKMSAVRLLGYKKSIEDTTRAVARKIRKAAKYGR